jgi:hypothetical protein
MKNPNVRLMQFFALLTKLGKKVTLEQLTPKKQPVVKVRMPLTDQEEETLSSFPPGREKKAYVKLLRQKYSGAGG